MGDPIIADEFFFNDFSVIFTLLIVEPCEACSISASELCMIYARTSDNSNMCSTPHNAIKTMGSD